MTQAPVEIHLTPPQVFPNDNPSATYCTSYLYYVVSYQ